MKNEYKVPIKNIYYMLCYAWDLVDYIDKSLFGSSEFDNIYNLLGKILVKEIRKLVKRGFSKDYIEIQEILSNLKGQIDIDASIRQNNIKSMKLTCNYNEYSNNILLNQIIKTTLTNLISCPYLEKTIKLNLKSLLIYFRDVDLIFIQKKHFEILRFNQNNMNYKMILNVCKLIRFSLIGDENSSKSFFADFVTEDKMNRIYEKFLLNFYKIHLDKHDYEVRSTDIKWNIDQTNTSKWIDKFDVDYNPGNRRTDIVIKNKDTELIIDAKFYKDTLVSKYYNGNELTYRASHLNQVRGYILDTDFCGNKIGALIYPTNKSDLNKGVLIPIFDSPIIIKTINLNDEWEILKNDLISFIAKIF